MDRSKFLKSLVAAGTLPAIAKSMEVDLETSHLLAIKLKGLYPEDHMIRLRDKLKEAYPNYKILLMDDRVENFEIIKL